MQQLVDQATTLMTELDRRLEPLVSCFVRISKEMEPTIRAFIMYDSIAKVSEATGWLPYRTVPFAQLSSECDGDVSEFHVRVSSYYEANRLAIVDDVSSLLHEYEVDDEAKATLDEALKAHRQGLYRCSSRVLLPEIERVIREDWLGIPNVASLKWTLFKEAVNKRKLSAYIQGGPNDMVLFNIFASHMFKWVSNRADVESEPTPNRHAAAHAWVPYSTSQSSFNAIICADYVFRLTTYFKLSDEEVLTDPHVAH